MHTRGHLTLRLVSRQTEGRGKQSGEKQECKRGKPWRVQKTSTWPANAASVAPITAWRLECQGTSACAALSSSLGASLFLASFFVFLGSLAACASFKGVHFAEVLEDKQMCLLDTVSLFAAFLCVIAHFHA